ncbi:Cytochrome P450 [Lactarius tabidus]
MAAAIPFITVVEIVLVSTILHLFFAFRDHRRRRGLPYPPGPKPWPIIGNLLESPKHSQWITYTEMSKKHGDILYLQVFGQPIVVLCSLPAIKDLLEKRGETFSDRPTLPMHHIMEADWLLPITGYGDRWREGRKIAERILRPGVMSLYHQRIEEKTRAFLEQILASPADIRGHLQLFQGKTIMSLVYGHDPKENDKMVEAPVQLANISGRFILPGAALVNYLPFLRHIPSWVPWLSYEPLAQKGRFYTTKISIQTQKHSSPSDSSMKMGHSETTRRSLSHLVLASGSVLGVTW